MSSSVEQIKSKLSIVEVVGSYLKLEKAGANYRACCPFHNEKTPSFFVSPARGSYHCFGCNRGGDIIAFVQEIEGLDFLDALRELAKRAGVELAPRQRNESTVNQRLLALLDEATNFYFKQLTTTSPAIIYLLERGLTKETIKHWRLGFAPVGWRHLGDYLTGRGYSEEEMLKTGLIIKPTSSGSRRLATRGYDRFRSRLMFPLFNPTGRVVGFSGRTLVLPNQTTTDSEVATAKYINTPQTELYDKSAVLYGYDRAKQAIRQKDQAIFVEGQMDLLMSHQAGMINTVAVSGTALTVEHLRLVKRLTERVILAYDYDLAGLSASRRAIDLLRASGFEVKIAKLPSGQDPAEVIKNDPAIWQKALTEAKHYIDFMIDALLEEGQTGLDLNRAVNLRVLPYLKSLEKKMEQAHFVTKLSTLLNISEASVWADLEALPQETLEVVTPALEPAPTISRWRIVEERLFGLFFLLVNRGQEAEALLKVNPLIERSVFDARRADLESLKDRLALAAELVYDPQSDPSDESAGLLNELLSLTKEWQREKLKADLTETLTAVQQAERVGDTKALDFNLQKYRDLTSLINKLTK